MNFAGRWIAFVAYTPADARHYERGPVFGFVALSVVLVGTGLCGKG